MRVPEIAPALLAEDQMNAALHVPEMFVTRVEAVAITAPVQPVTSLLVALLVTLADSVQHR
jgi:hypothetical protein